MFVNLWLRCVESGPGAPAPGRDSLGWGWLDHLKSCHVRPVPYSRLAIYALRPSRPTSWFNKQLPQS